MVCSGCGTLHSCGGAVTMVPPAQEAPLSLDSPTLWRPVGAEDLTWRWLLRPQLSPASLVGREGTGRKHDVPGTEAP